MIPAVIVALALDFRLRIAVALVIAVLLLLASRSQSPKRRPGGRVLAYLARIAYSVFLVHFPICLVVNAAWSRFVPDDPWRQGLGIIFAWAASVATGALFHRLVESRTDACIAGARHLLGLAMPRMPRVRQSGSGTTG
jgi:peptidoglycan/LPS O-acetylase OafA/YrhL